MVKILIISLIVSNLFWIFIFLDRSVTIDHLQMEITNINESIQMIKSITLDLLGNKSRDHIIRILNEKYSDNLIKEDDLDKDIIYVNNVVLRFKDGLLIDIYYE